MDSSNLLIEGAKTFGIRLDAAMCDQLMAYSRLILEWNEKINLTSITDEEGMIVKHFLDSLSVCRFIETGRKSLIDVGTGAGFPGIPLKIVGKELSVTLLDSLEKRVKFLNEVISLLSLKEIQAVHGRAEDFGVMPSFREKYDYAIARAVADLAVLCEYCLPFVKIGGHFIAMKGPMVEQELLKAKKAISILGGEVIQDEKLVLPSSDYERTIILIRKCRQTSPGYPRKSGKPTKSPLI